jgi:hypothetical protein
MATGTATLNFGTVGARRASAEVDVTGQSGLTTSSLIEAFQKGESTTDHTDDIPRFDPIRLDTKYLSATSFRIYGVSCRGHTYGDRKVGWATV